MDKRVDKSKEFVEEGMTLITEVDSERHLRRAKKLKDVKRERSLTTKRSGQTGFAASE